jgi:hypothetical protein
VIYKPANIDLLHVFSTLYVLEVIAFKVISIRLESHRSCLESFSSCHMHQNWSWAWLSVFSNMGISVIYVISAPTCPICSFVHLGIKCCLAGSYLTQQHCLLCPLVHCLSPTTLKAMAQWWGSGTLLLSFMWAVSTWMLSNQQSLLKLNKCCGFPLSKGM